MAVNEIQVYLPLKKPLRCQLHGDNFPKQLPPVLKSGQRTPLKSAPLAQYAEWHPDHISDH